MKRFYKYSHVDQSQTGIGQGEVELDLRCEVVHLKATGETPGKRVERAKHDVFGDI